MSEIAGPAVVRRAAGAKPARAPRVLMSPFTNTTNPYIDLQKQLLEDLGYDVLPLSVRSLFRDGRIVDVFRRSTVLVFHWIELRAFTKGGRTVLLSPKGLAVLAFYCALMALGRAKVVYFVHDHAVHNARRNVRRVSVALMSLVRRLADFRVVHAPDFDARYDARYLPHPLYWDAPGSPAATRRPTDAAEAETAGDRPRFAMLGTIQPYKEIAGVLEVWPHAHRLDVAGHGNASYVETLRRIMRERALDDAVTLDARFLSDDEFERKLCAADVLILPHSADSMLVSGAFFEAIGRVPVVIARAIPFMTWAARRFDNVLLFERVDELPALIDGVMKRWPDLARETAGRQRALDEFGWQACRVRYRQFFGEVVGVPVQNDAR
ncbi:glycosyltransferase family 1 protein [Paraburkholderia caballeronis]|uniref:glycosyltransferase family 1 protein n=1 Tax=Paraburkholderia caballeronis TaxID=416943 RepID=UPI00106713DB|nr:glycosyltransferase family 1 protein [Paraburkholderia caballeronis]TDV17100.1 glycosyltransferase involved in cell wall biosynthesis [Paraburkholderia caballeronis]TDV17485.1 glycosyltransferase involved in cell wall biosynthesis [Paraburkholderia caballeronis]TDV27503.1 glycosyltransferase involved in cell wall biosynthesis [Paraburkholderia caballeronis]